MRRALLASAARSQRTPALPDPVTARLLAECRLAHRDPARLRAGRGG